MARFQNPETIICSITVTRTDTGAATNPSTSMIISIFNPGGAAVVSAQAMTNDGAGLYHYDYTPSSPTPGTYHIRYTATNGSRVTIQDDFFDIDL